MFKLSTASKWLLLFFVFVWVMIFARIYFSHSLKYVFLIWNLFLAWVPFEISRHIKPTREFNWLTALKGGAWLLFFPNALYIITDFVHLRSTDAVPVWYDAVLLFSATLLGLLMAFISLIRIEKFLSFRVHKRLVHVISGALLFLSSFGVYLGRFQRWNSWDIIKNPIGLLQSAGARFIFPLEHGRTWVVTIVLFGLFSLMYRMLRYLPEMLGGSVAGGKIHEGWNA